MRKAGIHDFKLNIDTRDGLAFVLQPEPLETFIEKHQGYHASI